MHFLMKAERFAPWSCWLSAPTLHVSIFSCEVTAADGVAASRTGMMAMARVRSIRSAPFRCRCVHDDSTLDGKKRSLTLQRAFAPAGLYPSEVGKGLAFIAKQALAPPSAFWSRLFIRPRTGDHRRRRRGACGRGRHAFAGKSCRFANRRTTPRHVLVVHGHRRCFGLRGRVLLDRRGIAGLTLVHRLLVRPLRVGLCYCVARK